MGLRFNLEQASLVGWLTRRDFPPPMDELDWRHWPEPWDWHFHWRRHHALNQPVEPSKSKLARTASSEARP